MRIEYGEVTSIILTDPIYGAQLCHVKWKVTDREYQNCEIVTPRWVNYLPMVGDVVAICEVHNSEIIVLGCLEQYDLEMKPGEIMMHKGIVEKKGQVCNYNKKSFLKFNKDMEIEVARGETKDKKFQTKTKMIFNKDFERKVEKGITENETFKPKQRIYFDKEDNIIVAALKTDGTEQVKITIKQNGDITVENKGKIDIHSKEKISVYSEASVDVRAEGNATLELGWSLTANVSWASTITSWGATNITSGGAVTITAPTVQIV